MSSRELVPSSLHLLLRRQALAIDSGGDFKAHVNKLVSAIRANREARHAAEQAEARRVSEAEQAEARRACEGAPPQAQQVAGRRVREAERASLSHPSGGDRSLQAGKTW